jgi:periplasmic protein TonB
MFAYSLLESAPQPAHRAAWSKLASMLLQSLALAVVLAIPLFHVEHLQFVPPPPSIRMTSVEQPPTMHEQPATASLSSAPALPNQIVEPKWIPRNIARVNDQPPTGSPTSLGPPCGADCANSIPITNIISSGPPMITVTQPHPIKPPRVSEMQLGGLIHKVIPEYPIIAKQIHLEGAVVLMATVGKDGRVEHVQPISGPPLLVRPAMIAVEQWQYRPYLLNQEPVVVQTQITVNFVLNK